MILVNEMEKVGVVSEAEYEVLLKLLAPFSPHITEELWKILGKTASVHTAKWPVFDASKCVESEVTIAIQVGGKLRGTILVPSEIDKNAIEEIVLKREDIQKWLVEKSIKRIIFVQDKLINIVI